MSAKHGGLPRARASPWNFETVCCSTVNWSAENGRFRCRSCDRISDGLRDRVTGEVLVR